RSEIRQQRPCPWPESNDSADGLDNAAIGHDADALSARLDDAHRFSAAQLCPVGFGECQQGADRGLRFEESAVRLKNPDMAWSQAELWEAPRQGRRIEHLMTDVMRPRGGKGAHD